MSGVCEEGDVSVCGVCGDIDDDDIEVANYQGELVLVFQNYPHLNQHMKYYNQSFQ
ncbi:13467_t:CDS:2, partial [Entrophospora sp. SA101]